MNNETFTFRAWLAVTVAAAAWVCHSGIARAQLYQPYCPDGTCPIQAQPQPYYQPAPVVQPHASITAAVVRVRNKSGRVSQYGSGTLVEVEDGSGLILSCGHLFDNGQGAIEVYFPNGQGYQAELVELDQVNDLSAFEISAPQSVRPVTVAATEPYSQEVCTSGGYGGEGRILFAAGPFSRYVQSYRGAQQMELLSSTRQGDSGGPVFNSKWQLCGVVLSTNSLTRSTTVDCAPCTPVRGFLGRARARWQAKRAARIAQRQPQNKIPTPAPLPYEPTQPPLVEVTPPSAIQPTAPAAPDTSIVDKLKADLEAANKVIKDKADALAKLQQQGSASGGEAPKWDGQNHDPPPDITTPNVIEKGVERVATKAGTAWLTTLLVGLGLPAGPAGVAAGLAASAAIGFAGYKFRGWRANKHGSQNTNSTAPYVPPLAAEVARVIHPAPDPARTYIDERHHNQYVEVPNPTTDKAWASAHAIYGARYPGAANTLKAVEKLKEQILKGEYLPTQ